MCNIAARAEGAIEDELAISWVKRCRRTLCRYRRRPEALRICVSTWDMDTSQHQPTTLLVRVSGATRFSATFRLRTYKCICISSRPQQNVHDLVSVGSS